MFPSFPLEKPKLKGEVTSETDFTISFKVEGLESNTKYTYTVQCISTSTADSSRVFD